MVSHTFDPKSEAISRQLRLEEGFEKGRWFSGPLYPSTATYAPVQRSLELFSSEGSASPWSFINTERPVAAAANTPECLKLIKSWVSDCDRKHAGCKKLQSTVLPDRVVFVGSGTDPHLVEPQGTRAKYIALSHRWGGDVSLQLKKGTLNDFKRCIPFSHFPQTFQDAIIICRALAVDYIWIDSICIIQDSKQDWEVQGSKMGQVYANCLLTIAADAAENCHAGFLNTPQRQDVRTKTRKLPCLGPGGEKSEIFVRPLRAFGSMGGFGRHYNNWEREDLESSKRLTEEGSYLLRRGWVLQETLLPRRVLHFLPDEVTWRCPSASRCECKLRPHDKVAHVPLDLEEPREINTKDLKKYWKEIVEQYTRRQLTFPSDRLAAVAGVASRAHSVSPNVDYYAGLWSDALPSTLLWVVYRAVELERHSLYASDRIKPSIAPTWSWASITGHATFVFWQRNFRRGKFAKSPPDLTVMRIYCTPSGQNKYGNVSDARLTATGYLCKVHVCLVGGSRWHYPFKMEAQERDGKIAKSQGLFYPDIDEFLESLQATGERGTTMTVVSVYESRIFLVLREVSKKDLVFERVAVLYCDEMEAVALPEWGHRQRFTLV